MIYVLLYSFLLGNKEAMRVLQSWANADWFLKRPEVPKKITVTVFKVNGETNTDDLSPATGNQYAMPYVLLSGDLTGLFVCRCVEPT